MFRSEPGLVPDWYWYCAGLTSMHHGLARFRQSKMGSRLASDSSRIGALALHWRLDTGLAVIANLRKSSPICQSGGNPLIPRHYKQSRLTWIGVIGGEKIGVLYPYDIRFLDWQDWRRALTLIGSALALNWQSIDPWERFKLVMDWPQIGT